MALFPNGFMPALRNNSDTLLQTGIGLIGGRTANEQAAMGLQGFAQGRKQNQTAKWLMERDPELAQQVMSGMISGRDALNSYNERKTQAEKPANLSFQTLPDGTYGFANPQEGTFNALGTAEKPNTKVNDVEVRRQAAEQYGLGPDDPRYESYVLTGKMPREDAQPLTATDKKAILEADEMVLATKSAIPLIDRAIELNDKAYDGTGAGIRGTIAGNLGFEGGENTMELDNVVTSQALGQLKAIFGAAPTEGERKILLDIQGSVNQPANVRAAIFKRAKAAAERRLQFYDQRAKEMRGGEFYRPQGAQGAMGQQPAADPGGVVDFTDYFK